MADRFQAKTNFLAAVGTALASQSRISAQIAQRPLPQPLQDWLARLRLLKGVPFGYLVPDERMLPPESIRFFTLDQGWVETMVDGAMSIGRTLGDKPDMALIPLEAAAFAHSAPLALAVTPRLRALALGVTPAPAPSGPITGFVLRSKVVSDTPGMGVNVYPQGHTPADHDKDPTVDIQLLDILRYETLGDASDVVICLVAGEAYRVDIHQPPEQLHYGLDVYEAPGGTVTATKKVHTFTIADGKVTLAPDFVAVDVSADFRPGGARVAKMAALGQSIATTNKIAAVDAAEMGFEMVEGVGMVSFIKGYKP
ncbi:MAG: hypothetical protein EOP58_01395 [Sphingomonadales bacterium]|nr:MAG: hypothetical protein EOP58_01395 [Sphingomonadales bacterium]